MTTDAPKDNASVVVFEDARPDPMFPEFTTKEFMPAMGCDSCGDPECFDCVA